MYYLDIKTKKITERKSVQCMVLRITGGQLTLNALGAKTFMFVHDKLVLNVRQQKGSDNNINYKYTQSNTPT